MRFIRLYIVLVIVLISVLDIQAQHNPKPPRDFSNIKTPDVHFVEPDSSYLYEEETGEQPEKDFYGHDEEDDEGEEDDNFMFDGAKEMVIGMEDTSTIGEGEISIVEVEEELKMDCVWVKIAEYYSIWDSRAVNPYRIAGREIDNVYIVMYDSLKGRGWSMPLINSRHITSGFKFRHTRWHYGVDLGLNTGDSILSAFDGIVRMCSWDGRGYGNYVLVRHYNGLETLYGHMSKTNAKVGDFVKAGDLLGYGGSTGRSSGPHLHFEVRYAGNPIDPTYFYDFPNMLLRFKHTTLTSQNFAYQAQARRVYYHTVRSGQTLSHIARKYNVPVSRLCKMNGISTRTSLRVGRRLRIR